MKKIITIGALSFFILLGFIFLMSPQSLNATQFQSLDGVDFISTYQKTERAVLLDVRTPNEFNEGHLKGAIVVDFDNSNFVSEIQKLDKTKPYFVYCRSGNRSGQAVAIMKKQGFQNIYELRGGIVSNQNTLTFVK